MKVTHVFRHVLCSAVVVGALLTAGCSKESRAAGHLTKADAYYKSGDYERARLEYLNVLRLVPAESRAIERVGMIYQDQGAVLLAAPYLVKAAGLAPGNAELRSRVARIYLMAGDIAKAREEAYAALEIDPSSEEAVLLLVEAPASREDFQGIRQRLQKYREKTGDQVVYHLADAVVGMRERDAAATEAALGRALALNPGSGAALFLLGRIEESRTNLVAADQAYRRAAEASPQRSMRRVRYAEFKARTGAREEAVAWLEAMVKQAPDYLPAIAVQAEMAFAARNLDGTLAHCDEILRRYPLHWEASLLRSRVRLIRNEAEKAIQELERLGRVYGRLPQYQYQLALAQAANREPNRAIATLERLIQASPEYPDAILLLAQLNLGRGQADAVIQSLSALVQDRPGIERARLLLADAYLGKRRYEDALRIFRGLAEAAPQDPRGPFLSGLVLRQQQKFDEARQEFEKALQVQPKFISATVQLVELDLVSGDTASALSRSQEVVRGAPEVAGAHFLLARVELARTNRASAEASLKKTIELDPATPQAYLLLAGLYREEDRVRQSLEQLDRVLEQAPRDVAALMLKATIHAEQKEYEEARSTYETLLQVNSNFSAALNNLAYLHIEQIPDLDKAWTYARRARELLPERGETADTLGWVAFKRGEFLDALGLLQEASEKLPSEPEVAYHLAMAYYMMAQEGPARAAFERAVQLGKEFPDKAEAQRRLVLLASGPGGGPEVRRQLEAQVRREPRDIIALLRLADIQIEQGDLRDAQSTLDSALKLNAQLPRALVSLARLKAEDSTQHAEALRLVRRAREAAPSDGEIAWMGGRVALRCSDAVLALALLQDAARASGQRPEILVDLAEATYLAGRLDEAAALCRRVQESNPPAPVLNAARELDWLIQAYRNPAAAAEKGEAQVIAMLKRSPQSVPVEMAAAGVHARKGRATEARDLYQNVLSRVSAFAPAHCEMAILYAGPLKDDARAHDHATKARQAMPNDPVVAKVLGTVTFRRGDYRYAAQLLQEAARELATDAESWYLLGMAQEQLKQPTPAKASLEKALELAPGAAWAPEAKAVLGRIGGG